MSNQFEMDQELPGEQRQLAKYVLNELKADFRKHRLPAMEANIAPNTYIVKWYDLEYLFDLLHQKIDQITIERESLVTQKRLALDEAVAEENARLEAERIADNKKAEIKTKRAASRLAKKLKSAINNYTEGKFVVGAKSSAKGKKSKIK